jgi:phosphate transport system permease protein
MTFAYILLSLLIVASAFLVARSRAGGLAASGGYLHSLPAYHGLFAATAAFIPLLLVLAVGWPLAPKIVNALAVGALPSNLAPVDGLTYDARVRDIVAAAQSAAEVPAGLRDAAAAYGYWRAFFDWAVLVLGLGLGLAGGYWALRQVSREYRARNRFEQAVKATLFLCSAVAVLTTLGIVASVLFETVRFFSRYPVLDFLFGLQWSPQTAIREDQVGQSGAFGAVPLFVGTGMITVIAILVAGPIGLLSAIYLSEYASQPLRKLAKPVLEVLAGIPTVVFGFFAALTIAPLIRQVGTSLGLSVASESALAAGLVMGVMIIPFVSSLSDDIINAVPQSLRDGSYAIGATKAETIKRVLLRAALPGIASAFMLAISRAVGETMIVVMAAGLSGNLTFNPLEAVTTVTVQIKTLLVGDQEFDSTKTLSAFALGFVLFFFTLALNFIALRIVRKYREQYD